MIAGRIAKALIYLRREAKAAALDEVAAAIGRAELCIGTGRQDADALARRLPIAKRRPSRTVTD